MTDYDVIPLRTSARTEDIASVKQLQDEEIRLAHFANKALLYYISGGKEPIPEGITDKVRDEDQDLRGWFAEMYGDNYLSYLTSNAQTSIPTSERVATIAADFELNPYGYILRTGAVNEYHLSRIVTHASNVNKHRTAAIKYSGNLVTLCADLLFSGEVPNHNLFEILHTSIRSWYSLNGITTYNPDFERKLISLNLANPGKVNHTTYVSTIVMALFDIDKAKSAPDDWHNYTVPNAEVEMIAPSDIKEMIEAIDGRGLLSHSRALNYIGNAKTKIAELEAEILELKRKGWDSPPLVSQKHKDGFNTLVNSAAFNVLNDSDKATYRSYAALEVGVDVLPRNAAYMIKSSFMGMNTYNTNSDYANHDAYLAVFNEKTRLETGNTRMQTQIDDDLAGGVLVADYYGTPAFDIWNQLTEKEGNTVTTYKTRWIKYIYARVKAVYGYKWKTSSLKIGENNGQNVYSAFPVLEIPASYGQQVTDYDYIDISKVMAFYARALIGVTPTSYWNKSLSHRIYVRQEGGTSKIPSHSVIYLYGANMRTGGITNDSTVIGKVKSTIENAQVVAGTVLPDVPLYKPGTNLQLSNELKDSFVNQVESQPQLQQWLRQTNKEPFHYAYVIRSAWDPTFKLGNFRMKVATSLLGTRARTWYNPITGPTGSNPPVYNRHIDWMRASTYSNSNYKGVTTFAPTIDTLRYDPWGKRLNYPEFYEAKNTIAATEMKCVAFPKSTSQSILEFMESVPRRLSEILNSVANEANSVWSEAHERMTRWTNASMFGGWNAVESNWPEIPRKRFADIPGASRSTRTFYDKRAFIDMVRPFAEFLHNRTELLLIKDPVNVINKAYNRLVQSKPQGNLSWEEWLESEGKYQRLTEYYDETEFGEAYSDYMALLAAVAYLNSYHMLIDPPSQRTYPEWATPFKGKVSALITEAMGSSSAQGIVIYSSQINDTEDVSTLHRVLKSLGTFEGMTELPVYDVPEFHVKWLSRGPTTETLSSPFVNGVPKVPVGGLEAQVFLGLSNTYGDVFYNSFLTSAVLQPVFKQPTTNFYMYSSLRIPVNTRGVSSKLYGLRPGAAYSFDTVTDTQSSLSRMFTGSGGLTYTGLAGITGVAFVGLLGAAMFKNIDAEGAFADVRWKTD